MTITCNTNTLCNNLDFKVCTDFNATLYEAFIGATDTTIDILPGKVPPCKAIVSWGECNEANFELASYDGVAENFNSSGQLISYTLQNVVRGLASCGTGVAGTEGIKHLKTQGMKIGSPSVHYPVALLQEKLCAFLQEIHTIYGSYAGLPATADIGDFAFVQNGNNIQLYVYSLVGSTPTWLGLGVSTALATVTTNGLVKVACPGDATVFNRGCTVLADWYDNTTECSPKVLQTKKFASVYEYGSRVLGGLEDIKTITSHSYTLASQVVTVGTRTIITMTDADLILRVNVRAAISGSPTVSSFQLEVDGTVVDTTPYINSFDLYGIVSIAPGNHTINIKLLGQDTTPPSSISFNKVVLDYQINPKC